MKKTGRNAPDRGSYRYKGPGGGSGQHAWPSPDKEVQSDSSAREEGHVDSRERRVRKWEEATGGTIPETRRKCFREGVLKDASDLPTPTATP